jgi:hypothetical protein
MDGMEPHSNETFSLIATVFSIENLRTLLSLTPKRTPAECEVDMSVGVQAGVSKCVK